MTSLTSPDPMIQQLLQHPGLSADLEAWIAEKKYVTRKVMPGMWQAFLRSSKGVAWQPLAQGDTPVPPPVPQVWGDVPVDIDGPVEGPRTSNGPTPPLQEDLFSLLAKGLQGRLAPQSATLHEERVRQLIDYALKEEALHKTYRIVVTDGQDVQQRIQTDTPMPAWFPRVYKQATCRVHTLLVGPRGCGKTMTAELLATALELPFYCLSLSGGVDEGILQGWLLPVSDGLRFSYVPSDFVTAYTQGGVVLLDELDAADPNMLMIVNAALANGHWSIPLRHGEPPLLRHPNFVCVAAANTHGHGADRVYVGRNQLDGATLDRFAMGRVVCDYDEAMETAAFPAIVVEYGQRLRARCRAQQGWTRDVSTRNIADAARLLSQFTCAEAWYGYFGDWQDGELGKVGAIRDTTRGTVTLE